MYANENFQSKKDFKAAVAERDVECHQPGGFFPTKAGVANFEGPWYPKPHKWYATATVVEDDGRFYVKKGSKVS